MTRDELVDRARALQPLLARHAGDGYINRRLPDEVIDALTQAGLFRMLTPRRFGGYAVALRTVVQVSETLAMTDASAGWVAGLTPMSRGLLPTAPSRCSLRERTDPWVKAALAAVPPE